VLSLLQKTDIALSCWGSLPFPTELSEAPGCLKYCCHLTGQLKEIVPAPFFKKGFLVSNWGDAPAHGIAEGCMTLLLAVLKDLHVRIQVMRKGGWEIDKKNYGGSLERLEVGVYGLGAIGRRFVDMLRPFGCTIRIFDPYVVKLPEGCLRAENLKELFSLSQAVVIHVGLTPETTHSVNAQLLALLPDHGVIINTARAKIIDQEALFAELKKGRLRAGLDVTDPEPLPENHPARQFENLLITAHTIGDPWPTDGKPLKKLYRYHEIALDNIKRFLNHETPQFLMDEERYQRST
jgi:phosphoglycerate dehydrogenase-like enzyme